MSAAESVDEFHLDGRDFDELGAGDDATVVEVETKRRALLRAPTFPDAAMPGPWRDLVDLWASSTEAHPASIVLPALILCGIHGAEGVRVGKQRAVEYLALIGESSIGRKDTGVDVAVEFCTLIGARHPTYGQLNSGEGIWWELRDPDGDDAGAADKRFCLIDTEMGGTLAAGHRYGSTVFPALLSLFDTGTKKPLTKRDRVAVTNGHFSYVGLTVPSQFTRHVGHEDRESGFVQRLLVAAVEKVRDIPPSLAMAPDVDRLALEALAGRVGDRMVDAVSRGRFWKLSRAANEHLDSLPGTVVDPARPETARALSHIVRLGMLYALTVPPDASDPVDAGVVGLSHLRAAESAWRYCSESAARIFVGDNLVDKVVMLVADAGEEGLSRTELFRHLGNNVTAAELDDAIRRGQERGALREIALRTGRRGRPVHRVLSR